jgi:hypothetical protein
MVARELMVFKGNLLVIRMDVAGLTQWGSSWPMERVCGRGGIRKNCGNVWKGQRPEEVNGRQLKVKTPEEPWQEKPKQPHWNRSSEANGVEMTYRIPEC